MTRPFLVVYLKEMADALRDRRTALMVLVASVVTGPLTLVLLANYVANLEEKAATLKVRIAGAEHAPALVNFLARNDVEIETAPPDYEARVRAGSLDAVIVVPEDFDQRFLAGDSAKVEIVFDDSRKEAGPAIGQAERLLRAFNRETGTLRMVARGVSPDLAEPLRVDRVSTATPRQRGALLFFVIPMVAILSPLLGGMAVAIDSTAGERERGSLEPLLANPVSTTSVVVGKWLAAWTTASGVALLTIAGFVAAAQFSGSRRLSALMAFGIPELGEFALVIVPFAAMTSALQILICTHGRTYREAQTYVSYLATIVSIVPVVVIFSGITDALWQVFVPVLGEQMVLMRIVRGDELSALDFLAPSAIAAVIAVACLARIAKLLRDERIVFGRA